MSSLPNEEALTEEWHRKFASACNNRAWDLSVAKRTVEEDREMLDAAHASAWHWAQVGTELNIMRAKMLLAEVHALLGDGAFAFSCGEEVRTYFLAHGAPDWEMAFTHVIYAHAAFVAGRLDEHATAYRQAEVALSSIIDQEDRAIVAESFAHVPRP